MRPTLVKLVNADLRPFMPRVEVPTLLVWGSEDTDTLPATGREMERLIPDAGLVVLEGAGHYSYLDQPARFARIVSLSSRGHLRSPVVFDDLHFRERKYDPWLAYGQSKTANILLAIEAHPETFKKINALTRGRNAMAAVNPPLAVADLHREAVATLSFMIADAVAIRRAEIRHDARRKAAAEHALRADAIQIQAIGNQMTGRGF